MKVCQDDNVSYCGIDIQVIDIQSAFAKAVAGHVLDMPVPFKGRLEPPVPRVETQPPGPLNP